MALALASLPDDGAQLASSGPRIAGPEPWWRGDFGAIYELDCRLGEPRLAGAGLVLTDLLLGHRFLASQPHLTRFSHGLAA
jgi:hypothetical protein